jgi:Family of unknown function (DUF5808)
MKGRLLGIIPYDFERPSLRKVRDRMWNTQSNDILVPQVFGVGWTLNLAALKRRYPSAFWGLVAFVAWRVVRRWRSAQAS